MGDTTRAAATVAAFALFALSAAFVTDGKSLDVVLHTAGVEGWTDPWADEEKDEDDETTEMDSVAARASRVGLRAFGDERISDDGDDDGDGDHHSSGHVHCAGYARRARVRSRRERFRRRDVVFYPSNARFRDAQSSSARLDPSSHSRRERERELAGESSIRLRGEPRCGRGCVRASLAPSSRGVVGGVRERGRGGREGARRDSTLA